MNKRLLWGLILLLLWALPVMAQDMTPDEGYQEALRRIEEARASGATELDLSGLRLKELPPEIGQLTHLSVLVISNNQLADLPAEIGQLKALNSLNLQRMYHRCAAVVQKKCVQAVVRNNPEVMLDVIVYGQGFSQ